MAIVILGGGIIGLSTAYYLSELEPDLAANGDIHIVDSASDLLLSASGFAGGFLARDWFTPAAASLGALSFRLHKELADMHCGARNWSYAPSTAYSFSIDERGVGSKGKTDQRGNWLTEGTSRASTAPGWSDESPQPTGNGAERKEVLNEDGTPAWFTKQEGGTVDVIDADGGCAIVEPKQLCLWLLNACEGRGVKVHKRLMATSIVKGGDGKLAGLKVKKDCEIYEKRCSNIVIASGAWTPKVFQQLFPHSRTKIPVGALAGYSIVVNSPRYSKPIVDPAMHSNNAATGVSHAFFCAPSRRWAFAPECFSRIPPNGKPEMWFGGLNDSTIQLPKTADGALALMDKEKVEELRSATVSMLGLSKEGDHMTVDDLKVVRQGLCFRPISNSGRPIVSRVPEKVLGSDIEMSEGGGVFIASGHGPWGISMSLGTGKVVAEMVLGRKVSADVSGLRLK